MRTPTLALPAAGDSQVLLRTRRRSASEKNVEIDEIDVFFCQGLPLQQLL